MVDGWWMVGSVTRLVGGAFAFNRRYLGYHHRHHHTTTALLIMVESMRAN